jgi:hypothetical protein
MLRRTIGALDSTRQPHKYYKYGYVLDPRKMAPIERSGTHELESGKIRPPNKFVPDVETFLKKSDFHGLGLLDFKGSFESWKDLMTVSESEMVKKRGIGNKAAKLIAFNRTNFNLGFMPDRFALAEEREYYEQFKLKDHTYRFIPELPAKYRPHQKGVQQPPLPDYKAINQLPEWAAKEELRLQQKSTL